MTVTVRARVRNGRLIVDEPTDLPEGAELQLTGEEIEVPIEGAPVADEPLTLEEIGEVREILARGQFITHEEMRAKLDARRR